MYPAINAFHNDHSTQQQSGPTSPSSLELVRERSSTSGAENACERIGYIHASPLVDTQKKPLAILDIQNELIGLKNSLSEAKRRVRFRVEVATPQNLRMLATLGCKVLHYTGHGFPDGLAFEGLCGVLNPLAAEPLKELFSAGGVRTKLVFASACHSETVGLKFVEAGVQHVVAVKRGLSVTDHASKIFAESFYLALIVGKTVREAFDIGRSSVRADFLSEDHSKFLLLPEDGDHNVCIFEDLPEGNVIDETAPLAPSNCDVITKQFIGRNKELQSIFNYCIHGARCITLRGEVGIGKTSLAMKAIQYMRERNVFQLYSLARMSRRFDLSNLSPLGDIAKFIAECVKIPGADAQQMSVNSCDMLIEYLQCHGSETFKILLLIDGCDNLLQPQSSFFILLNEIMVRTSNVSVIMTAERACNSVFELDEPERVIDVNPLDNTYAAEMLAYVSPRQLTLAELGSAGIPEAFQNLGSRRVVQSLRGHPRAILSFAHYLSDFALDDSDTLVTLAEDAYHKAQLRPTLLSRDSSAPSNMLFARTAVSPRPKSGDFCAIRTNDGLVPLRRATTAALDGRKHPKGHPVAHVVKATPGGLPSPRVAFVLNRRRALEEATKAIDDRRCAELWAQLTATVDRPAREVPWSTVAEGLKAMVRSLDNFTCPGCQPLGAVTNSSTPRNLTDEDVAFLYSKMWPARQVERPDDLVSIDDFAVFSRWWGPVLDTLVRLAPEWYATLPMMIHGFVGRHAVREMLMGQPPGVFILRFSETKAGFLAISFTDDSELASVDLTSSSAPIHHCLVTVQADGCSIFFGTTGTRKYGDLRNLILDCTKLRRVFPGLPKANVFVPVRNRPTSPPEEVSISHTSSNPQDSVADRVEGNVEPTMASPTSQRSTGTSPITTCTTAAPSEELDYDTHTI